MGEADSSCQEWPVSHQMVLTSYMKAQTHCLSAVVIGVKMLCSGIGSGQARKSRIESQMLEAVSSSSSPSWIGALD